MKVLEILEKLESNANDNFTGCEHKYNTDDSRMKGYFCSDTALGHPNLEVFLSQVESELFEITKEPTCYSNLSQEE